MKLAKSHKKIFANFEDIIKDVELLPTKSKRQIKLKITFIDNTNLRITEILYRNKIVEYNYYYLDENNELIVGWDTAPHHKQLKNFPYHKHLGKKRKLEPSEKMNLENVLALIGKKIGR